MKIAIITDQHFGMRKGSQIFHEYIGKFYQDIFFPTLDAHGIDTVLDLGDTFDNRRNIDFWSLKWAQEEYYNKLEERGIHVYTVVGNHTAFYKNTNNVNTVDLLLQQYGNVTPIPECTEIKVHDLPILFIPWINQENEQHTLEQIQNTNATVAMGHLELAGFEAHPGYIHSKGEDPSFFSKFKRVFSGHYHTKSTKGNVTYLGNPYQIYWNDCDDRRGFHLFDTETLKLTYVENTYRMFKKFYYNDQKVEYSDEQFEDCKDKFVKVIVEKKTDFYAFDRFVDKIHKVGVHDLKIIENYDLTTEDSDEIEVEDTLTTLEKYVHELEQDHLDKQSIIDIIKGLYVEASEV
jgi:DNA repair exonuclease SbcCD nuclease subunit